MKLEFMERECEYIWKETSRWLVGWFSNYLAIYYSTILQSVPNTSLLLHNRTKSKSYIIFLYLFKKIKNLQKTSDFTNFFLRPTGI